MHEKRAMENISEYCRNMNGVDSDLAAHFTVIKNVGIALYGRPVQEVFGDVPKQFYMDSIKSDIANAENDIINNPVYVILNLCRVFAYIKEVLILSKQQGGQWGIAKLPKEYADMINKAIGCYTSEKEFIYDTSMLKQFASYMLKAIFGDEITG